MPHTRKKSPQHRKVKSKRSKKLIHGGGSDGIKVFVHAKSDKVFNFLKNSDPNITQTRNNYLEFIQSSRGFIDPEKLEKSKNKSIAKLKKKDDELFDENGLLKKGKEWDKVNIRFGFPLHESVVGYIKEYNTMYFVEGKEVSALCSFAFIEKDTGYITDKDITDHIHILSLVNNSNTVKLFTDTILKMFSKLQNVKYVSLNPLINKKIGYTHLTKFYKDRYQFQYINDSTCISSGSCVLIYEYKPPRRLAIEEKDYKYTIDSTYHEDIVRAIQLLKESENHYAKDEATLKTLRTMAKIQTKKGGDGGEKAIFWQFGEVKISFRLLSDDYDDRRNVDIGEIKGVEIIKIMSNNEEGMNLLSKDILDNFVKSVFHSFKFEKTFITRVKSTDIYKHITTLGFTQYTECQDEFTSEYCRMVKEITSTDNSSSTSSNATRSLQKESRVFPSSSSTSSNTRTSSRSSISSRSIEPPVFEKLVCKYTPKIGNNPIGSRDSGSGTGSQMGSDKDKDHPIFSPKRDGIDAHYSRFRVMMRLSEYIRDVLKFKVLKDENNEYYSKFINNDHSKAYFIIQTDKSKDIPDYERSLNLIVECDNLLVNNQNRHHDHKLIKGTDLFNTRIPDFDEFEEDPRTEPRIKRISNLSNTVANFFTFKVYCFALSNTIKHKNVVELIPSKREDVNRAVFKFVRDILCKDDGKGELTIRPGNDFNIFSSEVGRVRNQFGDDLAQWYETNLRNNEI